MAGDVCGGGAGKKSYGGGDLLGLAKAGQRDLRKCALADLLVENGRHVGLDEAGRHHIDGYPAAGDFLRKCLGEADHAGLAGGVVGLTGEPHETADGADIDDAPGALLHHRAEQGTDEVEGTLEIGVENGVPILRCHAHEEVVLGDPGVVHQDIGAAEVRHDLLTHLLHGVEISDIDGVGLGGSGADCLKSGGDLGGVGLAAADDSHLGTRLDEIPGDGFTDAASGSGYDGDLILQWVICGAHRVI